MRTAKDWKEFEVIDTSSGEKLERWGDVILARPDPQVIWNTPKGEDWKRANAHYRRSTSGGGHWEVKNMPREQWVIHYKELSFKISPTGFKHTGLFPEQAVNWDFMADKIRHAGRPVKVLNLFAYTGGATLAGGAGLPRRRLQGDGELGAGERPAFRPAGQADPLDCGRLQKVCGAGDSPRQPL